jgi:ribosomal protein L5
MPRLKERYEHDVLPKLVKEMGYKNRYQVPRLEKIVVKDAALDAKRTHPGS